MIIDLRLRPPFTSFRNINDSGRRDPYPDQATAPGVWLDVAPCQSFEDSYVPPARGAALSLDARPSLRASGER